MACAVMLFTFCTAQREAKRNQSITNNVQSVITTYYTTVLKFTSSSILIQSQIQSL